jgi:hypothetical protein
MTMIENNKTSNHGFAINDIVSIIYIYICFNKVGINVPIVTNSKVESTNKIFEDLSNSHTMNFSPSRGKCGNNIDYIGDIKLAPHLCKL